MGLDVPRDRNGSFEAPRFRRSSSVYSISGGFPRSGLGAPHGLISAGAASSGTDAGRYPARSKRSPKETLEQ